MVAKIIVGTDEKGFVYPKVQERTDICPICKNRIADVANLDYTVTIISLYHKNLKIFVRKIIMKD